MFFREKHRKGMAFNMNAKSRRINFITAYGTLLLICFLFQTTIAFRLDMMGIRPSILVAVVVVAAMFLDVIKSGIFACVLGFLCDAVAGKVAGLYMLTFLVLGLILGYVSDTYFRRNIFSALFMYGGTYILLMLFYPAGVILIFDSLEKAFFIMKSLFFEGLYSVIFLVPLFFIMQKIDRILATTE